MGNGARRDPSRQASDAGALRASRSLSQGVGAAVLILAALVVYRGAVSAYFFDDDFQWLVGTWAFSPVKLLTFWRLTHFYRPVIELYFALSTPWFDGSPVLFHLANIALHGANALLLFALARAMSGSERFGFVTALMFVVQPADVDAIAWVSALAEPLGAFLGCLSVLWFLKVCRQGGSAFRTLSVVAFLMALLTHESSVVFLPLLALAYWAFVARDAPASAGEGPRPTWRVPLRLLAPYIVVIIGYLLIDVTVNRRNYVVAEGHYRLGFHAVSHALDYIVALYVGKRNPLNYLLVIGVLSGVFLRGSRRSVFAACWLVLALLPFSFFTWGNTSRYLYLPAMGFSMLVAEATVQCGRMLNERAKPMTREVVFALLAGAVAVRFASFASQNVNRFAERTEEYRRYIAAFRLAHGNALHDTRVSADRQLGRELSHPFVNALVQWEYRDRTIELVPYEQDRAQDTRH